MLKPKTTDELKAMIAEAIQKHGNESDLNHIDVSGIDDISRVFL